MDAINSDPEVTRYLNQPAHPAAAPHFFERLTGHWDEHGFGMYALESREPETAGALLGFAGVAHPTFLPVVAHRVELGWRLARWAWGRGLGTEAAAACRDHAFERLGLPELISIIHPENERSRRLARRLGMEVCELVPNPLAGRDVEIWSVRPS
jgi:RimJ/RimL family protein N-acetyltransferase